MDETESKGRDGQQWQQIEQDGEKKKGSVGGREGFMEKFVCEQASAECNKRSSYSVRGSREEKVQFEKKLPETKEETHQHEADILQKHKVFHPHF